MKNPEQRTAGVIAPPPLIFLVPLLATMGAHWWVPRPLSSSPAVKLLGWLFVAVALVTYRAIMAFRRAGTRIEPWKPSTALVTDGPYRYSRNPMYLGLTSLYAGISLVANATYPLVALPLVLLTMHYGVVLREERYLAALFGAPYREYCTRVRRWL